MDSSNTDGTELLYSITDKLKIISESGTWMSENWEIMIVWRLLLFVGLWFWGIPRLLRVAYPDNGISKPEAYKEERLMLRFGLILLYILSESMNFYL